MKSPASAKSRSKEVSKGTASSGKTTANSRAGVARSSGDGADSLEVPRPHWTFLTNHSHVLTLLARNPGIVLREVALRVGITERAVQRIIADLEAGQFIQREKVGRQNHYKILPDQPLRHPIESHRTIGELLKLLN